jgi:hypothetical protein
MKLSDIILQEGFLDKLKIILTRLKTKILQVFRGMKLGDSRSFTFNFDQNLNERGAAGSLGGLLAEATAAKTIIEILQRKNLAVKPGNYEAAKSKIALLTGKLEDIVAKSDKKKEEVSRTLREETAAGERIGIEIVQEILNSIDSPQLHMFDVFLSGESDHSDTSDLTITLTKVSKGDLTGIFGFSLKTATSLNTLYIKDKSLDKLFMDIFGPEFRKSQRNGTFNYSDNREDFIKSLDQANSDVKKALELFHLATTEYIPIAKQNREKSRPGKINFNDADFIGSIFKDKQEYNDFQTKVSEAFAKALDTSLNKEPKAREAILNLVGLGPNTSLIIALKDGSNEVLSSNDPEIAETFLKWKAGLKLSARRKEGNESKTIIVTVDNVPMFFFEMNYAGTYQKFRINANTLKIALQRKIQRLREK